MAHPGEMPTRPRRLLHQVRAEAGQTHMTWRWAQGLVLLELPPPRDRAAGMKSHGDHATGRHLHTTTRQATEDTPLMRPRAAATKIAQRARASRPITTGTWTEGIATAEGRHPLREPTITRRDVVPHRRRPTRGRPPTAVRAMMRRRRPLHHRRVVQATVGVPAYLLGPDTTMTPTVAHHPPAAVPRATAPAVAPRRRTGHGRRRIPRTRTTTSMTVAAAEVATTLAIPGLLMKRSLTHDDPEVAGAAPAAVPGAPRP